MSSKCNGRHRRSPKPEYASVHRASARSEVRGDRRHLVDAGLAGGHRARQSPSVRLCRRPAPDPPGARRDPGHALRPQRARPAFRRRLRRAGDSLRRGARCGAGVRRARRRRHRHLLGRLRRTRARGKGAPGRDRGDRPGERHGHRRPELPGLRELRAEHLHHLFDDGAASPDRTRHRRGVAERCDGDRRARGPAQPWPRRVGLGFDRQRGRQRHRGFPRAPARLAADAGRGHGRRALSRSAALSRFGEARARA